VLVMLADHVCAVGGFGAGFRLTFGRLALPLFALVVGALADRPLSRARAWRWLGAGFFCGSLLYPLVFDRIGGGEVLLLLLVARWFAGCAPMWARAGILVVSLTLFANGLGNVSGGAWQPFAVIAIAVVGRSWSLQLDELGRRLSERWEFVGRRALSVYVVHLLVLAVFVVGAA
jgi:surface polysaccharide O-acyltransferase-like enzyme